MPKKSGVKPKIEGATKWPLPEELFSVVERVTMTAP